MRRRSGRVSARVRARRARGKGRVSPRVKAFRRRVGRGKIMKPSTFASIRRKAVARGARNPDAVAGKAYWTAAKSKARRGTTRNLRPTRRRR
jgi:hypothetical protein